MLRISVVNEQHNESWSTPPGRSNSAGPGSREASGLAFEADGPWLLIDCPHPIRKMMS
jgi:hypothetical protein